jgi:RHS repeat-associated protein
LDYYPYGATRISTNTGGADSARKYIDQFADQTGLDYFNARYYNASQGQFISQDPIFWEIGLTPDGKRALVNPQYANAYGYSSDNPITNKDPSGKITKQQSAQLDAAKVQLLQIQAALSTLAGPVPGNIALSAQSAINSAGSVVQQVSVGQANSFGAMAMSTPAYTWSGNPGMRAGNAAIAFGIPVALALPTGGLSVGATAPAIATRAFPIFLRTGPFIESVGVDSTLAEYKTAEEAAKYSKVPLGLSDLATEVITSKAGKIGAAVLGGVSLAGWAYYSYFGPTEKIEEIQ